MSDVDWGGSGSGGGGARRRRDSKEDERALRARAEGLQRATEAARQMQRELEHYAEAEEKTTRTVREATKAQDELTNSRRKAARQATNARRNSSSASNSGGGNGSAPGGDGGSPNGIGGGSNGGGGGESPFQVHFNFGSGRNSGWRDNPIAQIARARPGGGSGARFSMPNMKGAASGASSAASGAADAGAGAADAIGGAEAASALGGPEALAIGLAVGKVVKEVSEVVKAAVAMGKQLYDLAGELSHTTVAFTDLRAQVGGTTADAARATSLQRITGVDAGSAARGLNQHITRDPFAMAIAAKYGVYNIPGPYGRRDYGKMYNDLIERVSSNPNEDGRQREAEALGISQEVRRYYLLSDRTKQSLRGDSKLGAKLHDENAEKRAAELSASFERAGAATDNLKSAMGELFGENLTNVLDTYTAVANDFSEKAHDFNTFLVRLGLKKDSAKEGRTKGVTPPPGTSMMPWMMDPTKAGGAPSGDSPASASMAALDANTMATQQLTAAMGNVARVFGGGDRQRAAVPSSLHGLALIRAYELGAVGEGAL